MGRYRPPAPKSSNYITDVGERALTEELRYLWKVERPVVTQSVSEAAAMGDRSENADYIYGKKRLREIDRRVRYLSKRLEEVTVVSTPPDNMTKIYFAATVGLEDESGESYSYRIMGADEIDPKKGYISMDSIMGKALLGKSIEDEIEISSPSGIKTYTIIHIAYQ